MKSPRREFTACLSRPRDPASNSRYFMRIIGGETRRPDNLKRALVSGNAHYAMLIQTGRVEIKPASVSQLPFPENKFNLITAVETQYYWPDLVKDMQEILRVLKPGGTLIIIAESYKDGKFDKLQRPVMKLLRSANLGVNEQRELFSTAGYTDVQIFEERSKGWICVIGNKPSSLSSLAFR